MAEVSQVFTSVLERRRTFTDAAHPSAPLQPMRSWYIPAKTVAEFLLALGLFFVAVPVMVLAALLVKLTSRGPALYTQTRLGLKGCLFTIYKLRSMTHDCERASGPRWSSGNDPRVTPVGRFLRRTHIDELPQFWNVLRGDMSLIGPRPERPEFLAKLEEALPGYHGRLQVKPGVTGLAQVQLAPDTDLASVRRKLARDLYYVRHVSPWLDLRILFCTGLKLLGISFRRLRYFLPDCRTKALMTTHFFLGPRSVTMRLQSGPLPRTHARHAGTGTDGRGTVVLE